MTGEPIKEAAQELAQILKKRGYGEDLQRGVIDAVSDGRLICSVVLLATSERTRALAIKVGLDEGTNWLAIQAELSNKVSKENIRKFLATLVEGGSLNEVVTDSALMHLILTLALKHANEKKNLAIQESEIAKAVALLEDGVLVKDLVGVTHCTIRTLRQLPNSLVRMLKTFDHGILHVMHGVLADLVDLPNNLHEFGRAAWKRLLKGDAFGLADTDHIKLLDNTLEAVLAEGCPPDVARDWIVDLLDYDSVRLAIILYAQIEYGISLSDYELEHLQNNLEAGDLDAIVRQIVAHCNLAGG